jgi:cardiolipin synthase
MRQTEQDTIVRDTGQDVSVDKDTSGKPAATQNGSALNPANMITLARIIMVPVVFWLLVSNQLALAFYTFLIAGVTDAIDGYLAKRFSWQTDLGAHLDPLADKLLLVSVFVALGASGVLPSWLVIAVVARDILIVAAVILALLLGQPMRMRPYWTSKLTTTAQIVLVATTLADQAFVLHMDMARMVLIWAVGLLTVTSLALYLKAWLLHMSGYDSVFSEPKIK